MDAYGEAQQADSWDNVQGFLNGTPDGISSAENRRRRRQRHGALCQRR